MTGRSVNIDLRRDKVELASESIHRGLGLRAVIDGGVGFSATSDMMRLESVAESAVRSARARGGDAAWRSLPLPGRFEAPKSIFDASIDGISPEECIDLAAGMLQGCEAVAGAMPASGGVSCISGTDFIVNSQGVEISEKGTSTHASMEAIARDGDVASGTEFHNSRLIVTDLCGVGRAAGEMALSSLNGKKAESGTFEIILKPIAFAELIENAFVPSISADNVQKGRSHLAGRLGEKIGSEGLCIVDDGLLAGGMGTSSFDGEGVASQRNNIVEDGVLKGFLYDSYTAGKDGLKSTGNAVRSSYSEFPRVGLRNLVVRSDSAFDLLAETTGFLIGGFIGAHTANPISGDFSVEARNSFYIKPGEAMQPVSSMMVAGNIFDLLSNIDVGKDVRSVGVIVTPSVRAKLKVVGG